MNITLKGKKYKIAVCDECEDQAIPSAIKKLIPGRLKILDEKTEQLEALRVAAAKFGFELVKVGSNRPIPISQAPTINEQALVETLDKAPTTDIGGSEFKIQKNTRKKSDGQQQQQQQQQFTPEEADAAIEAAKRHASQTKHLESATPGEAATYASHDTQQPLRVQTSSGEKIYTKPQATLQENQTVRGRAGVPTTIPKSMQSADGKTTIKIVNTGGDRALQDRARQLGMLREHGDGSFYSNNCRPCQGRGFHGATNKPCRTCNGTGITI